MPAISASTARRFRVVWCASVSALGLLAIVPAHARPKHPKATARTDASSAISAPDKSHARHKASPPRSSPESMMVTARRAVSHGADNVIGKSIMAQFTPGMNPLKAIDRLPGVSFSSTDPLGIDTWGTSIYVRGFFMDQLGVTLDGIPLEEQIYQSVMGVNIIQSAISDDIERTIASEGPGGVNVPSTSTLGGTIQFETSDPASKMGGKVSQGFGSYGSFRTYLRGDTGVLNKSGTKAMVAYSRSDEKLWVGSGDQFQQQVDAKIVQPIGADSTIKAFFNWSQLAEWGYQDQSLSILDGLGWRVPHLYPNYALAYAYGQNMNILPTTPAIQANGQNPYLYDGGQAELDYTGGLNFDVALTDRLRWLSTLYAQSDTGYYTYADYATPSADTQAPFSEEVWQTRQERYGATTALRYEIGHHSIQSGVWFENNDQQSGLFWYNEPTLGQGAPLLTVGPYNTYGPAFQQGFGFQWHTNNFAYHLEDTWHPLHDLRITAGFKSMVATTAGGANYNNPNYTGADALPVGGLTASAAFLPHVGASWHFLHDHELYVDLAENMRTYQVQPYGGTGSSPWSVQDQATFLTLKDGLKPEKDWVYALGYRYTGHYAQASLAGYHADANHRLQAATEGSIVNPISTVVPSSVHINGVDAALTLTPIEGLALYNSVSYNHSTYGSNFAPPGSGLDTKGAKLVNYPQFMYKANLSYRWHGLETHFDVHYYSRRYFSYVNDTSIPGYWLASSGARYNLGKVGFVKNLMLDFNVYNLMNSKYISMMGENGNPVSGDYQSLERGSVRQYFGTISADF